MSLNPRPRDWTDPDWQESVSDEDLRILLRDGGVALGLSPLMGPNEHRDRPGVIDALVEMVRNYEK